MDYSLFASPVIITDRFASLSDDLQSTLGDFSAVETVRQVCRANYLQDEEKTLIVEQLTALVLMGFLLPDELAGEISINTHIHHKAASAIASEIDEKVFAPIKDQIKKAYSPLREQGAANLAAEIQRTSIDKGRAAPDQSSSISIKTAEKLKNASIQEKIKILKDAANAGFIGEIPDLEEHLKENEFKLYNEEKTYQDIADRSGLSLKKMVASESSEGRGVLDAEIREKISNYFKRMPSPGELDSFFKDFSFSKFLPFGMDLNKTKEIQGEIVRGVASGFSPQVMASFFSNLSKKDRLAAFERSAKEVGLKESDFAPANLAWLDGQAAQILGVGRKIFGL